MSLPDAVNEVRVPAVFSVSHVASSEGCSLRLALRETDQGSTLPAHPTGRLGRVVHRFIDRAVRSAPPETHRQELGESLESCLQSSRLHLDGKESSPVIGNLLDTVSPLQWARKKSRVLDAVQRSIRLREQSWSPDVEKRGYHDQEKAFLQDLEGPGAWTEVSVEDSELRLKGRMDLVVLREGEVEVHDFKTGRIHKRGSDQIKRSFVEQMWMYGLLASRSKPDKEVSLFVHSDQTHRIPFSERKRDRALGILQNKFEELGVAGARVNAEDTANPGMECFLCQYRHRCASYQKYVEEYWEEDDQRLPPDSWGRVEEVDRTEDRHVNLTLREDSGRMVRVLRLDRRRFSRIGIEKKLWLFGLKAVETMGENQRVSSAKNFYEIARTRKSDRAWSLCVYAQ